MNTKKNKNFKVYTMKFTRNELQVIRIGMGFILSKSDNKNCLVPAEYIKSKIEKKINWQ